MRVIEHVTIQQDLDPWLSLEALSQYSGLSVRSLRAYLSDPANPLPHYRMKEPHVTVTKAGKTKTVTGKVLVKKSTFDRWMEHFLHTPALDQIVDEAVAEFRQ